jgi:hypothetical protein
LFGSIIDIIYKSIVGLEDFIQKTSEWALDTSEWIRAVGTHWQAGFEYMKVAAIGVFMRVQDMASNCAVMMKDAFIVFFKWFADSLNSMAQKIAVLREHMIQLAENKRFATEEEQEKAKKSMTLINTDDMKPSGRRILDTSKDTRDMLDRAKILFENFTKDIFQTKKDLEAARKNKPFGPEGDPNKKKKKGGDKPGDTKPDEMLAAGMYDIPRFGKSIQEAILKKNPNAKMEGLLDKGNKIQEGMAKNVEDMKKNGGLQ